MGSIYDVILGICWNHHECKWIRIALGLVYAGNTVTHLIIGQAYSRALQAHFLTSGALMSYFLKSIECDIDFGQIEIIYKQILNDELNLTELESNATIQDIVMKNKSTLLCQKNLRNPRTVKLWKTYFKMANLFLFFIIF